MTPDEARKWLKETNIKFVLAQFVDIHGAAKAKAVPVSHLDDVLTTGAGFAGFAIWGLGMGPHGPDYMAVGDLATLSLDAVAAGLRAHRLRRPRPRQALRIRLARGAASARSTGSQARAGRCTRASSPSSCCSSAAPDGTVAPSDATDTLDKPCYDYKGLSRAARSSRSWSTRCRRWASTSTRSTTRTRTASSRSTSRTPTA